MERREGSDQGHSRRWDDGSGQALSIREMVADHDEKLDGLLLWQAQLKGAFRLMTLVMGTSLGLVLAEFDRATAKFGAFNSTHEGYAVIAEELDELWDDVKANRRAEAVAEAIQVAAMGIRFAVDMTREERS